MNLPAAAGAPRAARLLEVLTPVDPGCAPQFALNYAVFDFTPVALGVQGILWEFPSYVDGRPMMNRGIFDARILPGRPRAELAAVLARYLQQRGHTLSKRELLGHPERHYDPQGICAIPHIVLAGDAAGDDPLLGEGISWALRYGRVAAHEVARLRLR